MRIDVLIIWSWLLHLPSINTIGLIRLLDWLGNHSRVYLPNSPNMLLQQFREHGYCELTPPSHSESQQISIGVGSSLLHDLPATYSNGRQVCPLILVSQRRNIIHQRLIAIALIDVEVQDCSTEEVGVVRVNCFVGVVLDDVPCVDWLEFVLRVTDGLIHKKVLRGVILSQGLSLLSAIERCAYVDT